MILRLFLATLLFSFSAHAEPLKSAAGLELGGNGTLMFSDPSLGVFGAGAGLQGSLFFTIWTDRPTAGKLRIETVKLQEVTLQKTSSDYILPSSYLKSFTQGWDMISLGAEGHFTAQFQSLFWEALLGYAIGKPSTVTVTYGVNDVNVVDTSHNSSSGLVISGGIGLQRVFSQKIIGIMSLRTMFFLGSIYNSTTLNNKAYIPFPLMFNVGVQVPFDLGK